MIRRRWIFFESGGLAAPFDFAVIRYAWLEADGRDLDTRTALIEVDASVNGKDVGWTDPSLHLRNTTIGGTSGTYLHWGGDNTDFFGAEAVLVDFPKIATDFPALTDIRVRMRANWYGERFTGAITLQFATYLGGSMNQVGTDFEKFRGRPRYRPEPPANVTSNVAADVDGEDVGVLVYHIATKTASII